MFGPIVKVLQRGGLVGLVIGLVWSISSLPAMALTIEPTIERPDFESPVFNGFSKPQKPLTPRRLPDLQEPQEPQRTDPLSLDRPAGLERDVAFWRRVFTEITTSEGFVHDDARLDIVYARIQLPENHSPIQRRTIARAEAQRYADILRSLASGSRDNLSREQADVLALWGEDVDNDTLLAAADRIRFQLGQADRFREGLTRSGLWANHIEQVLAEAQVPPELIALPHVESAFHPGARSHAGAVGLWQFIPSTGRQFMQVDSLLDERLDPYRSSEAAAALLRRNYEITGSWPTAITAYNHGSNGMLRAINETGTTDIETIVRNYRGRAFGFASRNFYVSFLAAAEVRANAEQYFGQVERDTPEPTTLLKLPAYAQLDDLSRALGIDRQRLAALNPSLRRPILDGTKHLPAGYRLRVPAQADDTDTLLAAVPNHYWQSRQIPDQYHVVQRGETLSSIAPRYGARVHEIVGLNGLSNAHRIRVGQRLILPGAPEARSEAAVDDGHYPNDPTPATNLSAELAAIAHVHAQRAQDGNGYRLELPPPDLSHYAVGSDGRIRVEEGESLGHYAHWLGVPTQALRSHNGLSGNSVIRVGQQLRVDLSDTDQERFAALRQAHHAGMQARFIDQHRLAGMAEHVVRPGESLWILAERRYGIPVWLLRHFNPDLDPDSVRPGTKMVIPRLEAAASI